MRFDPEDGDEKAFFIRRDELGEQFAQWLNDRGPDAHGVPGDPNDAALLMDWKWSYSDGALDTWTVADVADFLFEWCVRKLSASPQDAAEIPLSVAAFVEFLAHHGLLGPAADAPWQIRSYCEGIGARFVREMGNPANFGMAKSLFGSEGALPLEDEEPDDGEQPAIGPVRLPTTEARLAAIRAVPIMTRLSTLALYCAPPGRSLTGKGNLRLADARHLVEVLDTGDDPEFGGFGAMRSADELPELSRTVEIALAAGAVRRQRGRLVAVARFAQLDEIARYDKVVEAAVDPTEPGDPGSALLVQLLAAGGSDVAVDELVDHFLDMVTGFGGANRYLTGLLGSRAVHELEQLADLGLVTLTGAGEPCADCGGLHETDGTVALTAAGIPVATEVARAVGVEVLDWPDPITADAAAIADLVGAIASEEWVADARYWLAAQPDAVVAGRVLVAEITAERHDTGTALAGLETVPEVLGDATVEAVRAQLGGPHDGLVLHWLIGRSALDPSTVEPERAVGGLIDVLAAIIDGSDAADVVAMLESGRSAEHLELLDRIWRIEHPRLPDVLDAIGAHHPVKAVAKAARKALVRHRSLLASR